MSKFRQEKQKQTVYDQRMRMFVRLNITKLYSFKLLHIQTITALRNRFRKGDPYPNSSYVYLLCTSSNNNICDHPRLMS